MDKELRDSGHFNSSNCFLKSCNHSQLLHSDLQNFQTDFFLQVCHYVSLSVSHIVRIVKQKNLSHYSPILLVGWLLIYVYLLEHVDHVVKLDEGVFDGYNLGPLLDGSTKDKTTNTTKAVDTNLGGPARFI